MLVFDADEPAVEFCLGMKINELNTILQEALVGFSVSTYPSQALRCRAVAKKRLAPKEADSEMGRTEVQTSHALGLRYQQQLEPSHWILFFEAPQ